MNILVIRRDNIGDLICTTPLIRALRQQYPDAHIAVLVNSYNAPVIRDNPDVDEVFVYTKAKHREAGETVLGVYLKRLRMFWQMRRRGIDLAILAGCSFLPRPLGLARWAGARKILGFVEPGKSGTEHITLPVEYGQPQGLHEVEDVCRLLQPLGITGQPPGLCLIPKVARVTALRQQLFPAGTDGKPVIGLHISARKVKQRWPVERFAELAHLLHVRYGCCFMLFWSPGAADNPHHPGDDEKAAALQAACTGLPLIPCPTTELDALVAGLSLTDKVICADGGAMHVAAGLGKPVVCLFGNSDAARWYPWGVPHQLLQAESRDVNDIAVTQVAAAFDALMQQETATKTPQDA